MGFPGSPPDQQAVGNKANLVSFFIYDISLMLIRTREWWSDATNGSVTWDDCRTKTSARCQTSWNWPTPCQLATTTTPKWGDYWRPEIANPNIIRTCFVRGTYSEGDHFFQLVSVTYYVVYWFFYVIYGLLMMVCPNIGTLYSNRSWNFNFQRCISLLGQSNEHWG